MIIGRRINEPMPCARTGAAAQQRDATDLNGQRNPNARMIPKASPDGRLRKADDMEIVDATLSCGRIAHGGSCRKTLYPGKLSTSISTTGSVTAFGPATPHVGDN